MPASITLSDVALSAPNGRLLCSGINLSFGAESAGLVGRNGVGKVETRAGPMRNAEGVIIQWNVICLDIENEVRAQEPLRPAQERLARASQAASLAELSASIAHEVNQPLAAVVANSHACQRWLTADPPNIERAHKTVERILRDANAAADVVSRVRALFKQSLDSRVATTFGGIIAEARELLAEEAIRHSVRMDSDVDDSLPLVAVDRVQLQQVLINLIRSGMEAMDALASGKVLRVRVRRAAEAIRIEVDDCGDGSMTLIEYSNRSSPRKSMAWVWGSRSAARSSNRMAENCGRRRTSGVGRRSSLRCQSK